MAVDTISGLGVGSNLDLQGTLDKLRQIDQAAIKAMQDRGVKAKAQLVAFDGANAKFLAAASHALSLSLGSNFLTRQVSSSDESVATATAALGLPTGSHDVDVVRLATKSSFQSAGVATADTAVTTTDATFAYKLGANGTTINVAVSANTTLTQLAEQINTATDNPGVTARVINAGSGTTPFRLVLSAKNTGEDHRISVITPLADLAFTEQQGASGASLNAALTVDGITYERQKNSGLTDVLQGVTLTLKDTGTSTLQISASTDTIRDDLKGLVTTLQEALQDLRTKTSYDQDSKTFGDLATSGALQRVPSELSELLGRKIATGGGITSLFDLGLEFSRDGSITLNESKLNTALTEHAEDVKTLLAGTETVTGLGTLLTDALSRVTQKGSGIIATGKEATQAQIDRLDETISASTARLNRRYDTLAKQFAALDAYAARQQQQSNYLGNIISSFNNSKTS
ncbi:MAG: hypothetical protein FJZ47_05105 [Candidatus Tectomicrobia bacterium]|uniref:Flagellar hook-associated protein 2 n=1 Tax=Tectimicrobiota bacterium TaxID=2528274 RepID=A0A938B1Q6_UNCTE|nr:hypothetical protein [Candidatus Tectomicrobia bacterium]